jgi:hypothetical protein
LPVILARAELDYSVKFVYDAEMVKWDTANANHRRSYPNTDMSLKTEIWACVLLKALGWKSAASNHFEPYNLLWSTDSPLWSYEFLYNWSKTTGRQTKRFIRMKFSLKPGKSVVQSVVQICIDLWKSKSNDESDEFDMKPTFAENVPTIFVISEFKIVSIDLKIVCFLLKFGLTHFEKLAPGLYAPRA